MMKHRTHLLIFALCADVMGFSACGKKRTGAGANRPVPARSTFATPGATEVGIASWYGHPYHGRRAANGEVYDMNQLTAAHRTLPFNTLVEVLNLDNQREVQVRINDRGPFIDGRIIDLSRAAAEQIAMIGPGTAKVRVEVLSAETPGRKTSYVVQIGAFSEIAAAERLQRDMALRYGAAYVENVRSDGGFLYRVRVGPKSTLAEATQLAASLQEENYPSLIVLVAPSIGN